MRQTRTPRFSPSVTSHLKRHDHAEMRTQNLIVLLQRIWVSQDTSRARLARETGLSRSAISGLVERLLEFKLIEECGAGVSTGGRKPTILRFNDEARYILGIDLGATHISAAITNLRGEVKCARSLECPVRDKPDTAIKSLSMIVNALLEERSIEMNELLGVGLAVASPINPNHPGRLPSLFMPAWRDLDLTRDLGLPLSLPLLIDNDANVGALAESWWGFGEEAGDLAFIKLGTGVGAGFVIDGRIYRGYAGFAGELGHIVIDPEGPNCVCGLRGCLATFIGTGALLERVEEISRESEHPHPWSSASFSEFLKALKEGDRAARQGITEAAHRLGLAVAGLLNMINPEVIVLGGDLARAGEALMHPLKESVQTRSLWTAVTHSRIVTSELGEGALSLGAATLVLQELLTHPELFFPQWSSTT